MLLLPHDHPRLRRHRPLRLDAPAAPPERPRPSDVAGGGDAATTAASALGGQADASLVLVLGNFSGCVLRVGVEQTQQRRARVRFDDVVAFCCCCPYE